MIIGVEQVGRSLSEFGLGRSWVHLGGESNDVFLCRESNVVARIFVDDLNSYADPNLTLSAGRLFLRQGVPSCAPYDDVAQPIFVAGYRCTLWHYIEATGDVDAISAVDTLRKIHGVAVGEVSLPLRRLNDRIARRLSEIEERSLASGRSCRLMFDLFQSVADSDMYGRQCVIHGDVRRANFIQRFNTAHVVDLDSVSIGSIFFDYWSIILGSRLGMVDNDVYAAVVGDIGSEVAFSDEFGCFVRLLLLSHITLGMVRRSSGRPEGESPGLLIDWLLAGGELDAIPRLELPWGR